MKSSFYSYSRKIIWLEAGYTNQDPKVIAGYYHRAISTINGRQPHCMWSFFRYFVCVMREQIIILLIILRSLATVDKNNKWKGEKGLFGNMSFRQVVLCQYCQPPPCQPSAIIQIIQPASSCIALKPGIGKFPAWYWNDNIIWKISCVSLYTGCPLTVRLDAGTENGIVATMQQFLRRHDHDDATPTKPPVIFGKSTGNQVLGFFQVKIILKKQSPYGNLLKAIVNLWR